MASESAILFEDMFDVDMFNPDGKLFERVSLIVCETGSTTEATLTLDICTEVYKLKREDKIQFALASTLSLSGKPDDGTFDQSGEPTLLDDYEYGMYGRIFEVKYLADRRVQVYASFGGLLMCLEGEQIQFEKLQKDIQLYCLIRKAGG